MQNPKLSFTQGNAKFDELKFKVPNTLDSETDTSNDGKVKKFSANSDTVDRKIHIRTGGTQDQLKRSFLPIRYYGNVEVFSVFLTNNKE